MEGKTITQDEIEIVYNLLEGRERVCIVDLGAADLTHSVRFRDKFGSRASIYAIEPDRNYEAKNYHNAKSFQIDFTPALISGEDREAVRFYPSTTYERYTGSKTLWAGSGSIYKPNKEFIDRTYPTLEFDEEGYEVKSYSWDTFVESRRIESVDYLHIDSQGAEYEIIKNMTKVFPDFIFAEISDFETYHTGVKLEDFDLMMFDKGYVLVATDEANALYIKAQKML